MIRKENRRSNLVINGIPRYIRCYSNKGTKNETFDCITVLFTKKSFGRGYRKEFMHIGASVTGSGFYQHGYSDTILDRNGYSHLGKKIDFTGLSPELQKSVMKEYCEIWGC